MNFHDRITITPDRRSGQPCIRGMRITVKDILEYLAGGMPQEQILEVSRTQKMRPVVKL